MIILPETLKELVIEIEKCGFKCKVIPDDEYRRNWGRILTVDEARMIIAESVRYAK